MQLRPTAASFAFLTMMSIASAETLVVCTEASPDFLNPQFSTANTSFDVAAQIYDRLVSVERGGSKIIPSLAEAWTISDDGLTYTFNLRKGVKWHASRAFTPTRAFNADDVIFSFRRMMDDKHPFHGVGRGSYEYYEGLVAPFLRSIEKVDDHTVRFLLKEPQAALLGALSVEPMSILSAEYADAMQKAGTPDQVDQLPIGTGPFSFVAYQKDANVRFRRFPEYWGAAAGLADRSAQVSDLVFAITPDPSIRYAKVKTGECHIARYPNPGDLASMKADPNLDVQSGTIADMSYLAFNTEKKPFDDRRVREALIYATNLPALVDAVYQGTGTPTASLIPPTLWGHDDDLKPRAYDPEKARKLLAESGYPNGFKTTLWAIPVVRAYMPNGRRAAELIQADWAKVGVEAEIMSYEWGEYLKRTRQGEHNVAMSGSTWDYPDPSQILSLSWSCDAVRTGGNRARWCNKEFSEKLTRANSVSDQAERTKLYLDIQKIFHNNAASLLFANAQAFTPVRKQVTGYKMHFFGGQPFYGVALKQ
jgi:dipeptide transport system substrate-binding protein